MALTPYQIPVVCKHFLPFRCLPFCSVDHLLCCAELILFDVVTFIFAFVAFMVSNPKYCHQDQCQGASRVFFWEFYGFRSHVQIFNPF